MGGDAGSGSVRYRTFLYSAYIFCVLPLDSALRAFHSENMVANGRHSGCKTLCQQLKVALFESET